MKHCNLQNSLLCTTNQNFKGNHSRELDILNSISLSRNVLQNKDCFAADKALGFYKHMQTHTLKSSMFDQPCLEIIFVLHLDKRKSNKSNKGETRQKCKSGGRSVLGSQTKTLTYLISFQSQLYSRKKKKKPILI